MFAKKDIPNQLTYLRIAIIPLYVAAYYLPEDSRYLTQFALFALASITDFFDGYLARKWNVMSNVGRALDPVSDKLIVAVALIILMLDNRAHFIAVSLIICREIWVAGLREALAGATVVHVSKLAKWKTATQMIAICALLLGGLVPYAYEAGDILLWVATALTVITGYQYSKVCLKALR